MRQPKSQAPQARDYWGPRLSNTIWHYRYTLPLHLRDHTVATAYGGHYCSATSPTTPYRSIPCESTPASWLR